jgi:hypothetical protein
MATQETPRSKVEPTNYSTIQWPLLGVGAFTGLVAIAALVGPRYLELGAVLTGLIVFLGSQLLWIAVVFVGIAMYLSDRERFKRALARISSLDLRRTP